MQTKKRNVGRRPRPGAKTPQGKPAGAKKQDTLKNDNLVVSIIGLFVRVGLVVVGVILVMRMVAYCYDFGYRIFNEPAMSSGDGRLVTVSVEEDMSAKDLGKLMEEKGLTRDWKLLALQYLCSEYKEQIQPRVYQVNTNMTAEEIFRYMASFYVEDEPESDEDEQNTPISGFEVEELSEEEIADEE